MKYAAPEESDEQVLDESKVSPWAQPEMTAEGSASRIMTALLEEVAAKHCQFCGRTHPPGECEVTSGQMVIRHLMSDWTKAETFNPFLRQDHH